MAYNTEELYKKAIEAIESEGLYLLVDVYAHLGIVKSTFFDHFPEDSNQSNHIKELLEKNKIRSKIKMRKNWLQSDVPALQLALYKLICTDDERRSLSMQNVDVTTKGKELVERVILALPPRDEE